MRTRPSLAVVASATAVATLSLVGCASDEEDPADVQTPASVDPEVGGTSPIVSTQVEQSENMGMEGDDA